MEGRLIGVGKRNNGDAELKIRGIYIPLVIVDYTENFS